MVYIQNLPLPFCPLPVCPFALLPFCPFALLPLCPYFSQSFAKKLSPCPYYLRCYSSNMNARVRAKFEGKRFCEIRAKGQNHKLIECPSRWSKPFAKTSWCGRPFSLQQSSPSRWSEPFAKKLWCGRPFSLQQSSPSRWSEPFAKTLWCGRPFSLQRSSPSGWCRSFAKKSCRTWPSFCNSQAHPYDLDKSDRPLCNKVASQGKKVMPKS